MDFLGKEGEKAVEAVQNLSKRVEDLESHLNAIDNVVQETREESRETDLKVSKENRERLIQLEDMLKQLTEIQKSNMQEINSEDEVNEQLQSKINSLRNRLQRTIQNQKNLDSRLQKLEKKIFNIEDELTKEIELNQSRIDSKLSESDFENDKSELEGEISRLKASINALANDLDDEKIRVE